jgi:hypothetical protein
MSEILEHEDRPVAAYHWNRLSRARVEAALAARFTQVTVTRIHPWLQREFGYAHTYNKRAVTMIAEREGLAGAQAARVQASSSATRASRVAATGGMKVSSR